jgi:hypothetical protein
MLKLTNEMRVNKKGMSGMFVKECMGAIVKE